ncbi:MAG: APC family permease [Leifsonia sp.]
MDLIDSPPAQQQAAPVTAPEGSTGLRKNALGTGGIVFMVISAAAPLTIIAGVAPLAILIGGISAPLVYAVAGIVLGIFAIAFMAMTRYVKALGGFYTYISQALGKAVGLGSSLVALVSYNALQIGLYGLMGAQGHDLLMVEFGIDVPWWAISGVGIAAVFLVAWRGIDVGAKVLGVLLAAEALILVALAVVILVKGGAEGITFGTFDPANMFNPAMFALLGVGFAAFMGFESTALYREEARDPDKTIPRATYISVVFMAVFYGFILWAIIIGLGESQAVGAAAENTAGLVFAEAGSYLGAWAQLVMYLLILTSVYASQLAFHNAINRYTFALARDGVLPAALERTDPKTGSPVASGLLQTVIAVIVVGIFAIFALDPYLQLLLWVNSPGVIGIILLQVLTCVAVVVFFARNKHAERKWYVLPAAIVGGLLQAAILYILCTSFDLLTAAGPVVNGILLAIVPVTFLVGVVLALVWKRTRPGVYARIGGANEYTEVG